MHLIPHSLHTLLLIYTHAPSTFLYSPFTIFHCISLLLHFNHNKLHLTILIPMAFSNSKLLFFLCIAVLFSCVFSYQFEVGGDEGWIQPSSGNFTSDTDDPYNVWAAHNRFRIGDSLRKFCVLLFFPC